MKMHKIQCVKTEARHFVLKITIKSLFNNEVAFPLPDIFK